jgi:hypothetical protein
VTPKPVRWWTDRSTGLLGWGAGVVGRWAEELGWCGRWAGLGVGVGRGVEGWTRLRGRREWARGGGAAQGSGRTEQGALSSGVLGARADVACPVGEEEWPGETGRQGRGGLFSCHVGGGLLEGAGGTRVSGSGSA